MPIALAAVVAVFVALQPRAERRSIEGSAVAPAAPSDDVGQLAAVAAQSVLGVPYVSGGAGSAGFDTSGLVVWAFGQAGRPGLPHYVGSLWGAGPRVPRTDLRVGDLVFFLGLSHVGISLGGDRFVHASPPLGVTVDSLSGYWAKHYDGAVRVLLDPRNAGPSSTSWSGRSSGSRRCRATPSARPARPPYRVFVANDSSQPHVARRVHFSLGGRAAEPVRPARPAHRDPASLRRPAPRFGTPLVLRVWLDDGDDQLVIRLRYRRP